MSTRGSRGLAALVLAGAVALCRPSPVAAAPFTPADDGEVLEKLSLAPLDPGARRLQELRQDLAPQPRNLALATRLAWLYIEEGRALSDPRYYGYAQAALAPWWTAAEAPAPILVLRATIRQHDHDFTSAARDLALAVQADPYDGRAWLTQAVVAQVQGDYAEAKRSCLQVLQLSTPLVAAACVATVESLSGSAAAGYQMLSGALDRSQGADAATRLWALTSLAEIAARRGEARAADEHFRAALGLGRPDDYLLGAYADFLLDQDRPAEIPALLGEATRADALLLRLALAEKATGAAERSTHETILRERFAAARQRGDNVHRREEARFALHLLDQADAALELASENWKVQREPWDARLLLEAAIASGHPEAARPVTEFVAATGLEDVALARLAAQLRLMVTR